VNHANILPGREYCEAVGLPQLEIKKVLDGWRTLVAEGLRNRIRFYFCAGGGDAGAGAAGWAGVAGFD